jgi:O-antigen biosynthesis protein
VSGSGTLPERLASWLGRLQRPWSSERLRRLLGRLRHGGVGELLRPGPCERLFDDYADWILARAAVDRRRLAALRRVAARSDGVGLPVFRVLLCGDASAYDPAWREAARASVEAQAYPRWQWLDVGAGSADDQGWVLILQCGERLAPDALLWLSEAIGANPAWQLLYSDSDRLLPGGQLTAPFFKPDWSPDLAVQPEYPGGLLAMRGGLWEGDGAAAVDLWLWRAMRAERGAVGHVARVLCHRSRDAREGPDDSASALVRAASVARARYASSPPAVGRSAMTQRVCLTPHVPAGTLVSIIIPLRDKVAYLRDCVDSIVARTHGVDYELVVVDNGSVEAETLAYLAELPTRRDLRARVVRADLPFNWSQVNNIGVGEATGNVLLFLNNDTEVINPDWLMQLAGHALRPDIGVVGALLLYPDGTVQHAGVVVGMNHWADHAGAGRLPRGHDPDSPSVPTAVTRNVLAVTGACLCVSRALYAQLGGLDERFLICGSDVAFGLEAWRAGRYNLFCAESRLVHHESKTRGREVPAVDFEMSARCYEPWRTQAVDPFHNPNLALYTTEPRLALRSGGR